MGVFNIFNKMLRMSNGIRVVAAPQRGANLNYVRLTYAVRPKKLNISPKFAG